MIKPELSAFEMGEPLPEELSSFFDGQAYLKMLTSDGVSIGNVTFEPGSRNHWHIHHEGGQILLVSGGRGYYQAWGEPAKALRAGDIVNIPAGVKHWHGATKDSWFCHLAIEVPSLRGWNEWLEEVSSESYNKLK